MRKRGYIILSIILIIAIIFPFTGYATIWEGMLDSGELKNNEFSFAALNPFSTISTLGINKGTSPSFFNLSSTTGSGFSSSLSPSFQTGTIGIPSSSLNAFAPSATGGSISGFFSPLKTSQTTFPSQSNIRTSTSMFTPSSSSSSFFSLPQTSLKSPTTASNVFSSVSGVFSAPLTASTLPVLGFTPSSPSQNASSAQVGLPILAEDSKGYVLSSLSARALEIHNSYYEGTKQLELVGGEVDTYDEYLIRLNNYYGTGPFMKTLLRISPELENALIASTTTNAIKELSTINLVSPNVTLIRDFTFGLSARYRELPSESDLQIASSLQLVQDRVFLDYKILDARIVDAIRITKGLVDVFIPEDLYDNNQSIDVIIETATQSKSIETDINVQYAVDRYIDDLEAAGYWVKLYLISGGDHTDIKATLVSDQEHGLVGAVLVGTLPAAWYRNANDAHGNVSTFPIDLYYMDLDGTWGLYAYNNDYFDSHTGDVSPEIWVGRILGNLPTTGKSEAQIIVEYLSRNHYFRTRNYASFPQRLFSNNSNGSLHYRALAFQDDDWTGSSNSQYLAGILTSERELINDSLLTNASNYLDTISEVPGGYWYLHLMAHASPTSHSFKTGSSWNADTVNLSELRDTFKRAHFYNLFNCSGARFTQDNFFGGIYVFGNSYGLGAVGSTKTGSMLGFDIYYANLAGQLKSEHSGLASDWDVTVGKKSTFGTAFLKWFRYIAKGGFNNNEKIWHYGMVYLGDPTLYPDWDLNKGQN